MTKENLPKSQEAKKKTITDRVLSQITVFQNAGELKLPKDYSPENALKSAYLILKETVDKDGKPVLETCTQESIARSLLKMIYEGLSPMKGQGYFIAYSGKLSFVRDYHGNILLAKRHGEVKKVIANAIYKDDDFYFSVEAGTGIKTVTKHEQTLESISTPVVGAYAVLTLSDGTTFTEVMNIDQIKAAWNMRQGKGLTKAHENFSDEMAKRTVINRACKPFIKSSDDSVLFGDKDQKQIEPKIEAEPETMDIEHDEVIEEIKIEEKETEEPKKEEKKADPGF